MRRSGHDDAYPADEAGDAAGEAGDAAGEAGLSGSTSAPLLPQAASVNRAAARIKARRVVFMNAV
jgi:hypothetical protein